MKNKEEILELLGKLMDELKERYHVKHLGLFGSYVIGVQKAESDIDFLVDFEEEADLFDLSGLSIFLQEQFGQNVDVVPKNALKAELRESILEQVIYS